MNEIVQEPTDTAELEKELDDLLARHNVSSFEDLTGEARAQAEALVERMPLSKDDSSYPAFNGHEPGINVLTNAIGNLVIDELNSQYPERVIESVNTFTSDTLNITAIPSFKHMRPPFDMNALQFAREEREKVRTHYQAEFDKLTPGVAKEIANDLINEAIALGAPARNIKNKIDAADVGERIDALYQAASNLDRYSRCTTDITEEQKNLLIDSLAVVSEVRAVLKKDLPGAADIISGSHTAETDLRSEVVTQAIVQETVTVVKEKNSSETAATSDLSSLLEQAEEQHKLTFGNLNYADFEDLLTTTNRSVTACYNFAKHISDEEKRQEYLKSVTLYLEKPAAQIELYISGKLDAEDLSEPVLDITKGKIILKAHSRLLTLEQEAAATQNVAAEEVSNASEGEIVSVPAAEQNIPNEASAAVVVEAPAYKPTATMQEYTYANLPVAADLGSITLEGVTLPSPKKTLADFYIIIPEHAKRVAPINSKNTAAKPAVSEPDIKPTSTAKPSGPATKAGTPYTSVAQTAVADEITDSQVNGPQMSADSSSVSQPDNEDIITLMANLDRARQQREPEPVKEAAYASPQATDPIADAQKFIGNVLGKAQKVAGELAARRRRKTAVTSAEESQVIDTPAARDLPEEYNKMSDLITSQIQKDIRFRGEAVDPRKVEAIVDALGKFEDPSVFGPILQIFEKPKDLSREQKKLRGATTQFVYAAVRHLAKNPDDIDFIADDIAVSLANVGIAAKEIENKIKADKEALEAKQAADKAEAERLKRETEEAEKLARQDAVRKAEEARQAEARRIAEAAQNAYEAQLLSILQAQQDEEQAAIAAALKAEKDADDRHVIDLVGKENANAFRYMRDAYAAADVTDPEALALFMLEKMSEAENFLENIAAATNLAERAGANPDNRRVLVRAFDSWVYAHLEAIKIGKKLPADPTNEEKKEYEAAIERLQPHKKSLLDINDIGNQVNPKVGLREAFTKILLEDFIDEDAKKIATEAVGRLAQKDNFHEIASAIVHTHTNKSGVNNLPLRRAVKDYLDGVDEGMNNDSKASEEALANLTDELGSIALRNFKNRKSQRKLAKATKEAGNAEKPAKAKAKKAPAEPKKADEPIQVQKPISYYKVPMREAQAKFAGLVKDKLEPVAAGLGTEHADTIALQRFSDDYTKLIGDFDKIENTTQYAAQMDETLKQAQASIDTAVVKDKVSEIAAAQDGFLERHFDQYMAGTKPYADFAEKIYQKRYAREAIDTAESEAPTAAQTQDSKELLRAKWHYHKLLGGYAENNVLHENIMAHPKGRGTNALVTALHRLSHVELAKEDYLRTAGDKITAKQIDKMDREILSWHDRLLSATNSVTLKNKAGLKVDFKEISQMPKKLVQGRNAKQKAKDSLGTEAIASPESTPETPVIANDNEPKVGDEIKIPQNSVGMIFGKVPTIVKATGSWSGAVLRGVARKWPTIVVGAGIGWFVKGVMVGTVSGDSTPLLAAMATAAFVGLHMSQVRLKSETYLSDDHRAGKGNFIGRTGAEIGAITRAVFTTSVGLSIGTGARSLFTAPKLIGDAYKASVSDVETRTKAGQTTGVFKKIGLMLDNMNRLDPKATAALTGMVAGGIGAGIGYGLTHLIQSSGIFGAPVPAGSATDAVHSGSTAGVGDNANGTAPVDGAPAGDAAQPAGMGVGVGPGTGLGTPGLGGTGLGGAGMGPGTDTGGTAIGTGDGTATITSDGTKPGVGMNGDSGATADLTDKNGAATVSGTDASGGDTAVKGSTDAATANTVDGTVSKDAAADAGTKATAGMTADAGSSADTNANTVVNNDAGASTGDSTANAADNTSDTGLDPAVVRINAAMAPVNDYWNAAMADLQLPETVTFKGTIIQAHELVKGLVEKAAAGDPVAAISLADMEVRGGIYINNGHNFVKIPGLEKPDTDDMQAILKLNEELIDMDRLLDGRKINWAGRHADSQVEFIKSRIAAMAPKAP